MLGSPIPSSASPSPRLRRVPTGAAGAARLPRACALVGAILVAVLVGPGCPPPEDPLEPLELEEGCQPLLAGADCMLPFPSDYFRVPDPSMPSGYRIELTSAAKPITDEGYSADVGDFWTADGASTTPPIVTFFGAAVVDDALVGIFDDPGPTLAADGHTLILDTVTGELVPHFVDLDPRATDPARQALVLRPLVGLAPERRYVVALQGVTGEDGAALPPAEGFRRLRDEVTSQDPALDALAGRFATDVFAPLAAAGVVRADLQQAWDFTTGSDARALGDMLRVRELVLAELAAGAPAVEITSVVEDPDEPYWRVVYGNLTGPLVLDEDAPGSVLARDDDGRVRLNGTTRFSFRALVPWGVRDSFDAAPALLFGHGFFGSAAAAAGGEFNPELLEETGAVCFLIDWEGMSASDVGEVVSTVGGEVSKSLRFGDRVHQAMANYLVLLEALKGPLLEADGFVRPAEPGAPGVVEDPDQPGATNAGAPVFTPDRPGYFGISNGHILGGVLYALAPDLERVVLQVGGASFGQMMMRALPFGRFLVFLDLRVPDPLDTQKVTALMQGQFDRFDPARFAPYVLDQDLPGGGPPGPRAARRLLLQAGIGDTSVPNFATFLHARLLGVPLLTPTVRTPWGLDTVTEADAPRAALTLFDLGIDDGFYARAEPPEDSNPVHEGVRRVPEAVHQTAHFLLTGEIVQPCGGPCAVPVPEGAAR